MSVFSFFERTLNLSLMLWYNLPRMPSTRTIPQQGISSLPAPRGISVQDAARALHYSPQSIRRLCSTGQIPAWKPMGRGKWLVDEVVLAHQQLQKITAARQRHEAVLKQGLLPL